MGLLERIADSRRPAHDRGQEPGQYLATLAGMFGLHPFSPGVATTYGAQAAEHVTDDLGGYTQAGLRGNGVVFGLELKRLQVFTQARFLFQRLRDGRPGDLYFEKSLGLLERPFVGGTTGDLLGRMLLDADFAGNHYATVLGGEIVRLRPDWVEILLAPRMAPIGMGKEKVQVGWQRVGYMYMEGGLRPGGKPAFFLPHEVMHFAPMPDPLATYRGMSWLTPVVRELQADTAATKHKLKFFTNAATPNLAVSLPKEITPPQFAEFVDAMDAKHKGVANAYKTLYTGGGADVTVIGADMKQLDFKVTQGAGETRLALAAGVHPVIAGLSEGMQGSSLNAGNYTAAKRQFVDTTVRHLWQNAAGSMQVLVPPPDERSRLWYDPRDVPFLHEDQKDAAEIQASKAQTIRTLVDAGFEPASVVAAVEADDRTLLRHSGLYSVQLQPPGSEQTGQPVAPAADRAAPGPRSGPLPVPALNGHDSR